MGCHPINGAVTRSSTISESIPVADPRQDSFYKPLTEEQSEAAFRNEYDFDSPNAIDFDILVDRLRDIKEGYREPGRVVLFPLTLLQGRKQRSPFILSRNIPGWTVQRPSIHPTC